MNRHIKTTISSHLALIVISFFFIIIPFFWFQPGSMDIGGDSGRFYFYDPISLLDTGTLYSIRPQGFGRVDINIFSLPFILLSLFVYSFTHSPFITIAIFNALKLFATFFCMYLVIKVILDKKWENSLSEWASIIGSLMYTFSPIVIGNFDRALLNHNQTFLNPLMFFLIFRYIDSKNIRYLWIILFITVLFSHNFAWVSAPPVFAFYPFVCLFLLIYFWFIQKKNIPFKEIFLGCITFLFLQLFQLIPTIIMLFDSSTNLSSAVFINENFSHVIDHFYAVLSDVSKSKNILSLYSPQHMFRISIFIPATIALGYMFNNKNPKKLILSGIFWLLLFYFVTADVSYTGIKIYEHMWAIPGFNMFRNFNGQFAFAYAFFYALLFGQALFIILSKFPKIFNIFLCSILIVYFFIGAYPYLTGEKVNRVHPQTNNIRYSFIMDSRYEKTLLYIRNMSEDTKFLTLPFTDYDYQVIKGMNDGAYVGPSTISYLAGKNDFTGYMDMIGLSDTFLSLVKHKDYTSIKKLLEILNIHYIFYNSDPKVYDTAFPQYPYTYMKAYFPQSQNEYKTFTHNMAGKLVYANGPYSIYSVDADSLPHIYPTTNLYNFSKKFDITDKKFITGMAAVKNADCGKKQFTFFCNSNKASNPTIRFNKVNPSKYDIQISNIHGPFVMVFSEMFNNNWKVYKLNTKSNRKSTNLGMINTGRFQNTFLDGSTFETMGITPVREDNHIVVNGYANGWYIDSKGTSSMHVELEITNQRYLYISSLISAIAFFCFCIWGVVLFFRKK